MRSILISGANQGLGFEAAKKLLAKPNILLLLGSRVLEAGQAALNKISIDKSSEGIAIQLDITVQRSVDEAAKTVENLLKKRKLDGLDVLVNNAGRGHGTFQEIYAVNVFGTASLVEAIRPLLSTKGASIVNVSSGAGTISGYTGPKPPPIYVTYGSSKAALNSMIAQWALQEKTNGSKTRVIAICPGYCSTNLNSYRGTKDPADGCQIIVDAALEVDGPSGVFYNAEGPIGW